MLVFSGLEIYIAMALLGFEPCGDEVYVSLNKHEYDGLKAVAIYEIMLTLTSVANPIIQIVRNKRLNKWVRELCCDSTVIPRSGTIIAAITETTLASNQEPTDTGNTGL